MNRGSTLRYVLKHSSTAQQRIVACLSLIGASLLILGYLWWGRFQYFHSAYLTSMQFGIILLIVGNHWYFRDPLSELGIRIDNLGQALRQVLPVTGLFAILVLLAAALAGEYRLERWGDLLIYLPWALIQQHGLQNFLFRRFRTVTSYPVLALAGAVVLFALFHLPNSPLMAATLLGGALWCWAFRRVPNLWAVSLSHALLAALLLVFFKFSLFNQFQIGRPGLRYEAFGDGVLVASGYDAAGASFIATLPGHDRGRKALVRLFSPDGNLLTEWVAFEGHEFSGNLSVGNLGYQEGDEIVVAPGPAPGNPSLVRVFNLSGDRLSEFEVPSSGYGVSIDISNNNIVVTPGPAPNQPARVMEYTPEGQLLRSWNFEGLEFLNSIRALLLEGDNEVSTVVLWGTPIPANPSQIVLFEEPSQSYRRWDTYGTTYGLNVSRIHLEGDAQALVTLPGPLSGYQANLKVFDRSGHELYNFLAHEDPAACGGNLSTIDLNGDGRDEVVVGEGICPGRRPTVRIMDLDGRLLHQWDAY
ncbi:MAG: CPBP family intramembrane glutamic endopeptidase [Acidobacteriota bacterium]